MIMITKTSMDKVTLFSTYFARKCILVSKKNHKNPLINAIPVCTVQKHTNSLIWVLAFLVWAITMSAGLKMVKSAEQALTVLRYFKGALNFTPTYMGSFLNMTSTLYNSCLMTT